MRRYLKMKTYNFYGWEQATVSAITNKYKGIHTPQDLYDLISVIQILWICMTDYLISGALILAHQDCVMAGHRRIKPWGNVLSQHFWFRTSLAARCMASCVPAETIIAITISTVISLT